MSNKNPFSDDMSNKNPFSDDMSNKNPFSDDLSMNPFSGDESILKNVRDNSGYIWKPINCDALNHTLDYSLSELSKEGLLTETDISTGWWIFENSKILYCITDKGIEYLKKLESSNN